MGCAFFLYIEIYIFRPLRRTTYFYPAVKVSKTAPLMCRNFWDSDTGRGAPFSPSTEQREFFHVTLTNLSRQACLTAGYRQSLVPNPPPWSLNKRRIDSSPTTNLSGKTPQQKQHNIDCIKLLFHSSPLSSHVRRATNRCTLKMSQGMFGDHEL